MQRVCQRAQSAGIIKGGAFVTTISCAVREPGRRGNTRPALFLSLSLRQCRTQTRIQTVELWKWDEQTHTHTHSQAKNWSASLKAEAALRVPAEMLLLPRAALFVPHGRHKPAIFYIRIVRYCIHCTPGERERASEQRHNIAARRIFTIKPAQNFKSLRQLRSSNGGKERKYVWTFFTKGHYFRRIKFGFNYGTLTELIINYTVTNSKGSYKKLRVFFLSN